MRDLVRVTGDVIFAIKIGVPSSTARSWLSVPARDVVSDEVFDLDDLQVRARILKLERKVKLLTAVIGLLLALRTALKIVGLSATRYHSWILAKRTGCELDDQSCCPRANPSHLLPEELRTMREMVTSPDYRNVPTGVLAMLAQRLGKLFANPATWYRLRPRTEGSP